MQRTFVFAFAASQLLGVSRACPLHANNHETVRLNNHRRSIPKPCGRTAMDSIRVFDGTSFTVPQTICFDGGYIVDTDGCDGASGHINGTNKFLIPGLIDSHIHLSDVESLENYTSYGLTTAIHMDCHNYTQCNIMAHQPGLATFVYAGMAAIGNGSLHEQENPARPKDTLIYPDTNVTQYTEWQLNNGSDFHKIVAEVNGPSTQQQIEMIQVARCQYQKQIMTHASDVMSCMQAVETDTDGIQHVPDDGILNDTIIQKIKSQNQFITPTLNVFKYAYTNPILQQFFAVELGSNRSLEYAEMNAKLLYEAGLPLITGTDSVGPLTVNGTTVSVPWGITLHYELENLVEVVGMSPAEAINSATRDTAKWHRIPDRGSVEVGKRADLVILNSDPLVNISNTQDIERVWVMGVEVQQVTKRT